MSPDDLLSTAEVADLAGITPATWRSYVNRGQAPTPNPADRLDLRTPRWRRAVIDAWLASRPGRGVRTIQAPAEVVKRIEAAIADPTTLVRRERPQRKDDDR